MKQILFKLLAVVGVISIGVLSLIIPEDPFKIIPALTVMSYDKPLWFCIMMGGSSLYLLALLSIYDCINQRK